MTPNVERGLWRAVPAALATEAGSLVVIVAGLTEGVVAGAIAFVALMVAVRVLPPPAPAGLRPLLLVAGPPLRYALLIAAALIVALPRQGGALPAVGCLLLLGLVPPLLSGGFEALAARLRPA